MIITKTWLHQFTTRNGCGWSRKQLACLGVSWPPRQGWAAALYGTEISDDVARRFEELCGEQRARIVDRDLFAAKVKHREAKKRDRIAFE